MAHWANIGVVVNINELIANHTSSVSVRFITIVVSAEVADQIVRGGAEALIAELGAQRAEGLLYWARMSRPDAIALVRVLERRGLKFIVGGVSQDIAVLDMIRGALVPCPWLRVFGVEGHLGVRLNV